MVLRYISPGRCLIEVMMEAGQKGLGYTGKGYDRTFIVDEMLLQPQRKTTIGGFTSCTEGINVVDEVGTMLM